VSRPGTNPRARFDPSALSGLDEPVRRYFTHALAANAPLSRGIRLRMRGRIKVGLWLPFRATWEGDARSLSWRADCGPGGIRLLRAVDRFADGRGSMDVRLAGRLSLVHAADEDTARSGAGRAAAEAIWTPASLLPERGVRWRAESEEEIVAALDVPPERPELHLRIDAGGAVRSGWVMRWHKGRRGERGYVPCGAHVLEERRFGAVTVPSRVTVGWWFDTPRYTPFFEAEIIAAQPLDVVGSGPPASVHAGAP
jgi:hypothetical protein